jgi:hypothetical protein
VSSASLILTDGGLALSEPKAVGAEGSSKVLAASSLGSSLVFVSSSVVTVALAAIGRDMRLSPLDLQWVMNAELLPLAALTLVAGALGDRFGQKRIFLAGIALYAYLISGAIESKVNDGETRIYRAGESWSETPGAIHSISRNASKTEPAKLLAVFVLDTHDNPLTTPVK